MSTTYTDEAARAARVLVLDSGQPLAEGTPAEIVAAIPGTITVAAERPAAGDERRRSWRRAGAWRVWHPEAGPGRGEAVPPDLQDAVCVAALRRELGASHA